MRRSVQTTKRPFGAQVAFARTATGLGWMSLGALAVGATAAGAVAIGALAIRALAVKRGRIGRLEIDELEVGRCASRNSSSSNGWKGSAPDGPGTGRQVHGADLETEAERARQKLLEAGTTAVR